MRAFLPAVLVLLLAAAVQADETSPLRRSRPDDDAAAESAEPLANFHVVAPGIFRSAQPHGDGYARLKTLGVKTILTLRLSDDEEKRAAEALGIQVEHVAMNGILTPTFSEVDRALDEIEFAEKPVLVHCAHGKDRTGFVIASYETTVLGLTVAEAVSHAREAGCCFVLYRDLADFLRAYARHRAASR